MKKIKKALEQYVGIVAIIAAIFYILVGGNIHIGGLRFRITYLVVAYICLKILYKLKSSVSYGVAIGLLGITGLFLLFGDATRADWSAVAAYIFMMIGILWHIAESVLDNRLVKSSQTEDGARNDKRKSTEASKTSSGSSIETSRTARKAQQATAMKLTNFRSHLNFGVSILAVIIIAVALLSPSVTALFADRVLDSTKNELRRKRKEASSKSRKGVAGSLNIKIVNGNKIPGEADRIAGLIKRKTQGSIKLSKSKYKDHPSTIMSYRIKHTEHAIGIVNHLSNEYFVTKTFKLSNKSPIDIELILGWDKKSLMKSYKVVLEDGSGRRSKVLRVAALLKQRGFINTKVRSINYVDKTLIKYNRSDKNVAKIAAEVLGEEYAPMMTSTRLLPKKVITIILGPE